MRQLTDGLQIALNRAVVDDIIGIFCRRIKGFHLHIHRGQRVVIHFELLCRRHIRAARHVNHLGDIVSRLADIDGARRADVEKRNRFAGIRRLHLVQLPDFFIKKLFCFVRLSEQQAIQLDPFHASHRMRFIAGMLDKHRNIHLFQLFLHFRIVGNHGRFYGKLTVFRQQRLIIRRIVLADILQPALLHRLRHMRQAPILFRGAGHGNRGQCIQAVKQIHRRRCRQIDIVQRLLQHRNAAAQSLRRLLAFRHEQILILFCNGNQRVTAVIVIDGKLVRILQLHASGRLPVGKIGSGLLRTAAAAGQQKTHAEQQKAEQFV